MMKASLASTALIYCLSFTSYAFILLQGKIVAATAVTPKQEKSRKLTWFFVPTGEVVNNNNSYDDYSASEVPADKSLNDAPDFLRTTDVCYKDGSYSLSNCPKPPDCNFSGKFGPAKLCINRVPRPDNGQYYVLVMKCIPQWENCDKCLCGYISSDRGANAKCAYVPGNAAAPDDDYMKISCTDLSTVKFQNFSWKVVTEGTTNNSSPTSAPIVNIVGSPVSSSSMNITQTLFQKTISTKKYKNSRKGVYKDNTKAKAPKSNKAKSSGNRKKNNTGKA